MIRTVQTGSGQCQVKYHYLGGHELGNPNPQGLYRHQKNIWRVSRGLAQMKQEEHENISLAMFGKKYREVHEFLDQFFPKYGTYHRVVLHHQLGISLVVQKFSGAVRAVAEQHIIDDMGCIPNDFREFDFEFEHANSWAPDNDLMADLKQLYPCIMI